MYFMWTSCNLSVVNIVVIITFESFKSLSVVTDQSVISVGFTLVDLETMLPFQGNFTANHTLNSCLKPKAIMMKALDVLSTRRSGPKTAEMSHDRKEKIINGSSDNSDSEMSW